LKRLGALRALLAVAACAAVVPSGCVRRARRRVGGVIKLATTTSTDNSGLLAAILPAFEKKRGFKVHVIAVGTGKAIRLGENGDVDVILVHAREAEDKFVSDGFGVSRRAVMHNDFVILGPASDPAGVKGTKDAAEALARISRAGETFVSRGDDSGTHKKEKKLWAAAGLEPKGSWYLSAGQGMGACLTIADEKRGYVIADRGTYLAFKGKIEIDVLAEGDKRLFNPYGVIAVNPERHPEVNSEGAEAFIEWLTGREAQKMIADFEVGGEQLFIPDALR